MIFTRAGREVHVRRLAIEQDVLIMDRREPDEHDRAMLEDCRYVVVTYLDGAHGICDRRQLLAEGGQAEIDAAVVEVVLKLRAHDLLQLLIAVTSELKSLVVSDYETSGDPGAKKRLAQHYHVNQAEALIDEIARAST